MYRLIRQHHDAPPAPFSANASSLLIGRDPGCGLRITDAGVRDQHAAIERHDNGYFIRDLTHNNAVRVNGETVSERRLASGDELELGAVRFIFEVVHEPPPERRSFDPWQLLAGTVVIALVTGQVTLLGWIFSQPHPRNMRTDLQKIKPVVNPPDPSLGAPTAPDLVPLVPLAASATAPSQSPEILSRMLKIARVDPVMEAAGVTLRIQVKAQVGERQLVSSAVAVSVQFFTAPAQPGIVQWLTAPTGWENFTSKMLIAHFTGPPQQYAGCVVRTYYRKQLQDILATPPALATVVPAPPLP